MSQEIKITERQISDLKEALQDNMLTVLDGLDDQFLNRVCGMIITTVDKNLKKQA